MDTVKTSNPNTCYLSVFDVGATTREIQLDEQVERVSFLTVGKEEIDEKGNPAPYVPPPNSEFRISCPFSYELNEKINSLIQNKVVFPLKGGYLNLGRNIKTARFGLRDPKGYEIFVKLMDSIKDGMIASDVQFYRREQGVYNIGLSSDSTMSPDLLKLLLLTDFIFPVNSSVYRIGTHLSIHKC